MRIIFLDFDGIILESNQIKNQAFEHVFRQYPQQLDTIMAYHRSHQGLIRFEKFRYIYEHILNEVYTPQIEADLTDRFRDFVLSSVKQCPFVPGALEFLNFYDQHLPLVLVSINPRDDLLLTLEWRGLSKYFDEVFATTDKVNAMKGYLQKYGLTPGDAIFIGDADSDYESAKAVGVPFIGRDSGHFLKHTQMLIFKDLFQIKEFLCQPSAKS